jgi:chromosome segregation ATPase
MAGCRENWGGYAGSGDSGSRTILGMSSALTATVAALAKADLTSDIVVPVVATLAIVVALLLIGLVLLFRNRDGAKSSGASGLETIRTRANVLLVRLDDALTAADDELGFAVAQFGEERTASFAAALSQAHAKVTEAFRLRRELDDSVPEAVQKQREWTLQIVALCEEAQAEIDGQDRDFAALRSAELNAPATISSLTGRIATTGKRLAPAKATLTRLSRDFDGTLEARFEPTVSEAKAQLDAATAALESAAKRLSPAGVNDVVSDLATAEGSERKATTLLDSIDTLAKQLDGAATALASLIESTKTDLTEAKKERDVAPDPETGAAIVSAISAVEAILTAISGAKKPADPVKSLDQLGAAVAQLDTALASARNQAQRLEHARTALVGTLVSAKSQISTVRAFITVGAGRVGADARTRLAEAERQLVLAEAESDPVDALDAARRAVTSARDADDLAHYDAMGGR